MAEGTGIGGIAGVGAAVGSGWEISLEPVHPDARTNVSTAAIASVRSIKIRFAGGVRGSVRESALSYRLLPPSTTDLMTTTLLALFSLTSAAVLVRAERQGFRNLVYLAKPLALVSVALIAVFAWPLVSTEYRLWILAGLALSLLGDMALMVPKDRFLTGLGAFFLAHVAYTIAFLGRLDTPVFLPYLPFGFAGLFVVVILWRHLDGLRIPVIAYAVAIAVMAGSAWAVAMTIGSVSAWTAAVGTLLFLFSDVVLALNRFVGEIRSADALIVWTYFPAQLLLALSVFA